jgi:putative transposase
MPRLGRPPAVDYRSGRHCVFMLHAHLVFTPKWRRKVFTGAQLKTMKRIFNEVCADFGAVITEFDGESDHVHLLVNYPPQMQLSKLINSLKGVSSRKLKTLHPEIKKHYWGTKLWSRSYFAGSVGGAPLEVLKAYIQAQATPA